MGNSRLNNRKIRSVASRAKASDLTFAPRYGEYVDKVLACQAIVGHHDHVRLPNASSLIATECYCPRDLLMARLQDLQESIWKRGTDPGRKVRVDEIVAGAQWLSNEKVLSKIA